MKLKKLDVRGVAHEFMIVGVLVIFSIVGIGYVVAGNANPSAGKAAAGEMQGGNTSGPANGTNLSCSIDSLPETATYKQLLKPYVRIKNEGPATYNGYVTTMLSYFGADGKQVKGSAGSGDGLKIKKGKTVKIPLPKHRAAYAKSGGLTKLHFSVKVEGLGWCNNTWVNLPQKPATTKKAPAPKKAAPRPESTGGGYTGGGEG